MSDIFIFHGGSVKRSLHGRNHDQDDGDYRVPLTCAEAQHVVHDPEIPGRDAPGAFGSTLVMQKHIGRPKEDGGLGGLAVGDYVYMHLLTPMTVYHTMAIASDYGVEGFKAEFDIVDACEVATKLGQGETGNDVTPLSKPITHDFSNGLGHAIKDAVTKAALDCKFGEDTDWTKYRNPDSMTHARLFDPADARDILTEGSAAYVRMRVTEIPDNWENQCGSCGDKNGLPRIQLSLTGHVTCIRTNEILPYCNCPSVICAGCEQGCKKC